MFELADELLTHVGYEHYEIANYARPGYCSRHNCGYWRRDGYLGLGVGAHSLQRGNAPGIRFSNTADPEEYRRAIGEGRLPRLEITLLSQQDAMAEFMFLGLRMAKGVAYEMFEREFGAHIMDVYGRELAELSSMGLLWMDGSTIRLTSRGMLLSNQVFARFLS
jgi:oxygen-independent coproporphyrinogen-3 oxidase